MSDEGAVQAPPIDVGLVLRLVEAQFPQWADLPVVAAVPQGWDNRSFRLGDTLVVRLPSAGGYAAQVDKENRWLPLLAPRLPLPVPVPVARGAPGHGYPWSWSVYRWINGQPATMGRVSDLSEFATTLAVFLSALQSIDPADGPPPGPHNFWRGGPLTTYAEETLRAVDTLAGEIPREAVLAAWRDAAAARWPGEPSWLHGDVAAGNLLVRDGRLAAVIDFGSCAVGDSACDVVIAWTLLAGASRQAFRSALAADDRTWARGRGWALWKALITLVDCLEHDPPAAEQPRRVIKQALADHARQTT